MFRRIVCATDFSDTAEAAWEVACELARTHGAELVLVHVFIDFPMYPEVAGPRVEEIWEEQRRWVQQSLEQRAAAARSRGLIVKAVVKTGAAAQAIAESASEERAGLLVVGTHGRTGFNRLVVGSVAERVVRLSPCPVLVVKPPAAREEIRAAA